MTVEEVVEVHDVLAEYFAKTDDPISPSGIKTQSLLESAVGRQHTGYSGQLKYPGAVENASTLVYGICMNHSFHNGNKRTALVSGLVHLNKNGLVPAQVTEGDFFGLMKSLAAHELLSLKDNLSKKVIKGHFRKIKKLEPDDEVEFLSQWFQRATKRLTSKIKTVKLRQLKRVLVNLGCSIEEDSNSKLIVRRQVKRKILPFSRELTFTIPRNKDNWIPDPSIVKQMREELRLGTKDGYGDDAFYHQRYVVDDIVHEYRNVLNKLAKT